MKIKLGASSLKCTACNSTEFSMMQITAGSVTPYECIKCGRVTKLDHADDKFSSRITGKINPARAEYAPERMDTPPRTDIPSTRQHQEKWILRDPVDKSDYLIRVHLSLVPDAAVPIADESYLFSSESAAKDALKAFKTKSLFQGLLVVPVDLWFLSVSAVERNPSNRGLGEVTRRLLAVEYAKKEMGWTSETSVDMNLWPTEKEIELELDKMPTYMVTDVDSVSKDEEILAMSRFVGGDLSRVPGTKLANFLSITSSCFNTTRRLGSMRILCKHLGLHRTSDAIGRLEDVSYNMRLVIRDRVSVPNGSLSLPIAAAFQRFNFSLGSLEATVLDGIREACKVKLPSSITDKKRLTLSHLVIALDLNDEYTSNPSNPYSKMLNLAVEIGMDNKYASKDELLHDLTYIAKGLGINFPSKEGPKDQDDQAILLKDKITGAIGDIQKADSVCLDMLHNKIASIQSNTVLKLSDTVVESPIDEKSEIESIVSTFGSQMTNANDAERLISQWGYNELLPYDSDYRVILCKALSILIRKFKVEPPPMWKDMIDNPSVYDDLRNREFNLVPSGQVPRAEDLPQLLLESLKYI